MINRALLSLLLLLCFRSGNGKLDCPAQLNAANTSNYDIRHYFQAFNDSLIERIRSKKAEPFYKNVVDCRDVPMRR